MNKVGKISSELMPLICSALIGTPHRSHYCSCHEPSSLFTLTVSHLQGFLIINYLENKFLQL